MSGLENAVRPALVPLIRGDQHTVTLSSQQIVAQWITMKTMVVCSKPEDQKYGFLIEERTAFYESKTIPNNLQIWIAPYDESSGPGYEVAATTILKSRPSDNVEYIRDEPNTHAVTICLGKLAIFTQYSRVIALPSYKDFIRIHSPSRDSFLWPARDAIPKKRIPNLIQALKGSGNLFKYSHRRKQIRLRVVTPHHNATKLLPATAPLFGGHEFIDIVCGNCATVLGRGVSVDTIRQRFAVSQELVIACPACRSFNLIPVKGTKRQRRGK